MLRSAPLRSAPLRSTPLRVVLALCATCAVPDLALGLEYDALTICAPGDRLHDSYATPVVIPDTSNSTARTLLWTEHDHITTGDRPSYQFVRWSGPSSARTCAVYDEFTELLDHPETGGSTPSADGVDSNTGSPVLLGSGVDRRVLFNPYKGWVNRYPVDGSGIPDGTHLDMLSVDMTPGSLGSTDPNVEGGDTAMLAVEGFGALLFGTKCQTNRLGDVSVMVECDASTSLWGTVMALDLANPGNPPLATHGLSAWVSSSPVGLSNTAGEGADELLFALGTDESTGLDSDPKTASPRCDGSVAPFDDTNDCGFFTMLFDGSSLSVADAWDDDDASNPAGWPTSDSQCCISPAGSNWDAANGFIGEPVPYPGDRVLALRHHAEFYVFGVDPATGAITRDLTIRFEQAGSELRIPQEHSISVGSWPSDPNERRAFFAINQTSTSGGSHGGYVVAIDPDNPPAACAGADPCVIDPATIAVDYVNGLSPFWGPGATVRVRTSGGGYELGYAVTTDATQDPAAGAPTWTLCRAGEYPAALHLYASPSPATAMTHEQVWLSVDPYIWVCHEANPGSTTYAPIHAISGVVAAGNTLYVSTSDGLFWEYHSGRAHELDPTEVRLMGYEGPWPRFRSDNRGIAW